MNVREKFRAALLDIITGPFSNTNGLLWAAYKKHLRDVNAMELPEKVREQFLELKLIYESKFGVRFNITKKAWEEAELKNNGMGYSYWRSKHYPLGWNWKAERKPTEQEIYDMVLKADVMHGTSHPEAKRIKELIFEIVEKLPKRQRKIASGTLKETKQYIEDHTPFSKG